MKSHKPLLCFEGEVCCLSATKKSISLFYYKQADFRSVGLPIKIQSVQVSIIEPIKYLTQ